MYLLNFGGSSLLDALFYDLLGDLLAEVSAKEIQERLVLPLPPRGEKQRREVRTLKRTHLHFSG